MGTNVQNDLTIGERLNAPTPPFFKKIRTIGLLIGAIGAAIVASPVVLHAIVASAAGYLITAGAVIVSVSSVTVDFSELAKENEADANN
jgi:hypothetical protein